MSSKKQKINKIGKYALGRTLGEGTFGKVKYAEHIETKKQVAIKILDKEKIQQQNMGLQIKREISLMKLVRNPHVVQLQEVLASKTKIYIVLELVTGGELFDEIIKETRFTEDKARFYFRQLVLGVEFCHKKGVCHRDLKPENLLLDEKKDLKISDFGLSNLLFTNDDDDVETKTTSASSSASSSRATLLHTSCGTPNYVAPEVLDDKGYDGCRADVWSMGVILYVLAAGCLPFDEPTMPVLFRKIKSATYRFPESFSEELKDLLRSILVADPDARASIEDIKRNDWYNQNTTTTTTTTTRRESVDADATTRDRRPGVVARSAAHVERRGRSDVVSEESSPHHHHRRRVDEHIRTALTSTPSQLRLKKAFRFYSGRSTVLSDVRDVLESIGCEVIDHDRERGRLRVSRTTPRGTIGLNVHLLSSAETTTSTRDNDAPDGGSNSSRNVVEIRRGKGDILEYHRFFVDLVNTKLISLIEEVLVDE